MWAPGSGNSGINMVVLLQLGTRHRCRFSGLLLGYLPRGPGAQKSMLARDSHSCRRPRPRGSNMGGRATVGKKFNAIGFEYFRV